MMTRDITAEFRRKYEIVTVSYSDNECPHCWGPLEWDMTGTPSDEGDFYWEGYCVSDHLGCDFSISIHNFTQYRAVRLRKADAHWRVVPGFGPSDRSPERGCE